MLPEQTINEYCKLQGMIAERIKAETGYDVMVVYGIALNDPDMIQCGAVYTHGMTRQKGMDIAASAKHFIDLSVPNG